MHKEVIKMRLKGKEIIIDPKFGDGQLAMNERTYEDFGVGYGGFEKIVAVEIGDDLVAVNSRTLSMVAEAQRKQVKAPKVEDKVKEVLDVPPVVSVLKKPIKKAKKKKGKKKGKRFW